MTTTTPTATAPTATAPTATTTFTRRAARAWLIWVAGFLAFPVAGLAGLVAGGAVDGPAAVALAGLATGTRPRPGAGLVRPGRHG